MYVYLYIRMNDLSRLITMSVLIFLFFPFFTVVYTTTLNPETSQLTGRLYFRGDFYIKENRFDNKF